MNFDHVDIISISFSVDVPIVTFLMTWEYEVQISGEDYGDRDESLMKVSEMLFPLVFKNNCGIFWVRLQSKL